MSTLQLKLTKRSFYLLSFDSPVRCFLPNALLPFLVAGLKPDVTHGVYQTFLNKCPHYNPLIGEFVQAFTTSDSKIDGDVVSFFNHLSERVHVPTVGTAQECTSIPSSYNPSKNGRLYYFSKDGSQIRKNRLFKIDDKSTHDDKPTTSAFTKSYPMVAKRGTSFFFLWFCLHGHCYGAHVIDGSEERKDAACSLYTHLKVALDVIFYDFACSLEEYCLNREADFFKNTRFYHDIFHGFSHSCSPCYSSKGLDDLTPVNTSNCEQFNSFLQCIKSSAKHMCQENFMFYLQFMIDIWNERKRGFFTKN